MNAFPNQFVTLAEGGNGNQLDGRGVRPLWRAQPSLTLGRCTPVG